MTKVLAAHAQEQERAAEARGYAMANLISNAALEKLSDLSERVEAGS